MVAHETRTIKHPDGSVETVMRTENTGAANTATATAEGAGVTASGEQIQQGFDASAPEISLAQGGGGSTSGGAIKGENKAKTDLAKIVGKAAGNPLMWVGILLLLAGIGCLFVPIRRGAMVLLPAGIGLIAVSFLPEWAWWLIAALALFGGALYVWTELDARKKARLAEKLRYGLAGVTRGVESLPADIREVVKRHVDVVTDDEDKAVIRDVKRAG